MSYYPPPPPPPRPPGNGYGSESRPPPLPPRYPNDQHPQQHVQTKYGQYQHTPSQQHYQQPASQQLPPPAPALPARLSPAPYFPPPPGQSGPPYHHTPSPHVLTQYAATPTASFHHTTTLPQINEYPPVPLPAPYYPPPPPSPRPVAHSQSTPKAAAPSPSPQYYPQEPPSYSQPVSYYPPPPPERPPQQKPASQSTQQDVSSTYAASVQSQPYVPTLQPVNSPGRSGDQDTPLAAKSVPSSSHHSVGDRPVAVPQVPKEVPPPSDEDISFLSTHMKTLNVDPDINQSPRPKPKVDDDGPKPAVQIRATGEPLEVVPICSEDRIISYSLYWYQLTDNKQYLTCSRCYEDHVKETPLAVHFQRVKTVDGSRTACGFWRPRVKNVLWPEAIRTNSIDELSLFMKHRMTIKGCSGPVPLTGKQGVKWFGLKNNEIDGFVACESCYEDRIVGNRFETGFKPFEREQGQDEGWSCDLCVPYMSRALAKLSEKNDWAGFLISVDRRLQLAKCEGGLIESNAMNWYIPRRKIENLYICEACYMDNVALTTVEREFEQYVPKTSLTSSLSNSTSAWTCKLTGSNLPMTVALNSAIERHDFSVFQAAAQVICRLPPCTANGLIRGNWWTLAGAEETFDVCEACHAGILKVSAIDHFFEQIQRSPEATIICDFCPESPRFAHYINKLVEALDRGVFEGFEHYVTTFSGVQDCPGIETRKQARWWGYPEALFCEECYLSFVVGTSLADTLPIKAFVDEREFICQIWSKRMRKIWLLVCEAGAPGTSESDDALKQFREFGTKRLQTYLATVPRIKFIRGMQDIKRAEAMNQAYLSVMYKGMDGFSSVMGTTDGHLHGNSQLGWYNSDYGAQSAQMFQNMQNGFISANKTEDWAEIFRLQGLWEQVE